jgi:hypothetical protein
MVIYYLVPVVFIAAALAYTVMMQGKVRHAVAEGRGAQLFHDGFADNFDALLPNETLIGVWMGQAYTAPKQGAGQIAGDLAVQAALGVIGVSTYTPLVYVGVTTLGRVLVAEEYSDAGSRGHFKVVAAFPPGAELALGAAAAHHPGAPPPNPFNPEAPLELIRLRGADAPYLAWVTSQGAMIGATTFVSIATVLPITAARATSIWQAASQLQAA